MMFLVLVFGHKEHIKKPAPLFVLFLTSFLTFVHLNCENLFDCRHDSLKQDMEYTPGGDRRWTNSKYWRKVRNISRELISSDDRPPDFITLCEVENDSVLRDVTRRSQLREMHYGYVMTNSADKRGIDVALLYNRFVFRPIVHYSLVVDFKDENHPLRDILYVSGQTIAGDTLHIFAVHAPSRFGGKLRSEPRRLAVMSRLIVSVDSLRAAAPEAKIVVMGDFNDEADDRSLRMIEENSFVNVSKNAAVEDEDVGGTYKYQGRWGSIDHILVSRSLAGNVAGCYINTSGFLLERDTKYGGVKPRRTYAGYRFRWDGYSDHLPLILKLKLD